MEERRKVEVPTNAVPILEQRYLRKDEEGQVVETVEEMFWRVAEAVAEAEARWGVAPEVWAERFYDMMARLDFLPNSPTLMNAGTSQGQLSACFVLPVGDSMEEIFDTLKWTALVHKSGGGTGFNFSGLRPAGDVVRSTRGVASGPVSFMELFDGCTEVVKQGGMRRGANMGILDCDHPDLLDFLQAKTREGRLANFNISVACSDAFMKALEADEEWALINRRTGETVKTLPAREIFDLLVESAWATGDPGLVFSDRLEADNPTPRVGRITATNPCGEQPLLPFESCNLGSINLLHMIEGGDFDWKRLERTVRLAVRFLDDVIEINGFPLPQIAELSRGNRKIGLGIMGWAEALFRLGLPYDSEEALRAAEKLMGFINSVGQEESRLLAEERGVFPNWEGSRWQEKGIPLRNATVTTIAPTGTIALICGCSSGIEPVFALAYRRKVFDDQVLTYVNVILTEELQRRGLYNDELARRIAESGSLEGLGLPEDLTRRFVTSHEIRPQWHVRMQAAFQRHTDNAVSKTINLPHEASIDDVAAAFVLAYQEGCKGITVYRDRCKASQILYRGEEKGRESGKEKGKRGPAGRPGVLRGTTVKIMTSFGNLYLTVNELDGKPFEVFATLGKSGKDTMAHTEALGRLISLALRSGVSSRQIVEQLKGIGGSQPVWESDGVILSLPDAVARGLERALGESFSDSSREMCPSCGAPLVAAEGCLKCERCGYSKCG
ncbi:MAG: vitamin B12-dependent ribonucleotide reductase [Synergistales bacterium]|nr:vitamin B12-dependent ribonucleotide reductase [Synergistales bacterium]